MKFVCPNCKQTTEHLVHGWCIPCWTSLRNEFTPANWNRPLSTFTPAALAARRNAENREFDRAEHFERAMDEV